MRYLLEKVIWLRNSPNTANSWLSFFRTAQTEWTGCCWSTITIN